MLYNVAADRIHINFVADFLRANCDFRGKTLKQPFYVFEPSFGVFRGNVRG